MCIQRQRSSQQAAPMVEIRRQAKARQASKLAEIREALISAGCDTTAKQAVALGVCRSTAWVLLNQDKRTGPSSIVIKRILLSPNLPPRARRKVKEYVEGKISGRYGHSERSAHAFRNVFQRKQSGKHRRL